MARYTQDKELEQYRRLMEPPEHLRTASPGRLLSARYSGNADAWSMYPALEV